MSEPYLVHRIMNGHHVFTSPDVPGLLVSHVDEMTARNAVPSAIKMLNDMRERRRVKTPGKKRIIFGHNMTENTEKILRALLIEPVYSDGSSDEFGFKTAGSFATLNAARFVRWHKTKNCSVQYFITDLGRDAIRKLDEIKKKEAA